MQSGARALMQRAVRAGALTDHGEREDAEPDWHDAWHVLAVAAAVAAGLCVLSVWAFTRLPPAMKGHGRTPHAPSPHFHWLQAFSWWDGAWYADIADRGYRYAAGHQSPVAFFPGYPLLVRAVSAFVRDTVLAGVMTTIGCGLGAAVCFHRWCSERLGRACAHSALACLLLYPCSFYLFGPIYGDSMFVLLAIVAFTFLEHDRLWLAGLAAAAATATRPTGLAVVIGLWARAAERQGLIGGTGAIPWQRADVARALRSQAGLLLAPLGLAAYATYLGSRFGQPFAFVKAEGSRGWHQAPGWATWLKVSWLRRIRKPPYLNPPHYHLALHALVTVIALAMVVAVFRRLGRGYGIYTLTAVAGSALSTKDFVGMGRYVLAAFPLFAAAGALLRERRLARVAAAFVSVGGLVMLTELHARNMLIS